MNVEHRTSNVQHRIMYSVNLKKLCAAKPFFDPCPPKDPTFFGTFIFKNDKA